MRCLCCGLPAETPLCRRHAGILIEFGGPQPWLTAAIRAVNAFTGRGEHRYRP